MGELHKWREHRPFCQKVLQDLGIGKPILEQKVQEEAAILVSAIRSENGRPFYPDQYFGAAIANIVTGLLYGQRFFYDDPGFAEAIVALGKMLGYSKDCALLNGMPWLQYLPGDLFAVKRIKAHLKKLEAWHTEQINIKKAEYDEDNLDNFVSCYVREKKALDSRGKQNTFTGTFLCFCILLFI